MKSFKQFFNESVESEANLPPPPQKFSVPPPRAKFQRGDVVLVQNPQPEDKEYFKTKLPKYMQEYTNAVGRIIGHRTIGIDTQFAVEFEDKTIGKMKGYFLVGPFRSIQSAKKYQGRERLLSTDIAAEDHKRYAEAQTQMPTDEVVENAFKSIFVQKDGFEWLREPVSFVQGKNKVVILAAKKVSATDTIWHGPADSHVSKDLERSLIFYKIIDPVTNQFVKTSSFNEKGGASSYGITTPFHHAYGSTFKNGKVEDASLYYIRNAIRTAKSLNLIYNQFQEVKQIQSIEDGMEYFDVINKVQTKGGFKIVPPTEESYSKIVIFEGITTDVNAFKNYIFEGNVAACCVVNGRLALPKEVRGDAFEIRSSEPIKNLVGFPELSKNCKIFVITERLNSFEGLPHVLNHNLFIKGVPSLNGFPKVINGDCRLNSIDSFAGGKDTNINGILYVREGPESYKEIPLARDYIWSEKDDKEHAKIKKYAKQRVIVDKELSKEFDISALEDF